MSWLIVWWNSICINDLSIRFSPHSCAMHATMHVSYCSSFFTLSLCVMTNSSFFSLFPLCFTLYHYFRRSGQLVLKKPATFPRRTRRIVWTTAVGNDVVFIQAGDRRALALCTDDTGTGWMREWGANGVACSFVSPTTSRLRRGSWSLATLLSKVQGVPLNVRDENRIQLKNYFCYLLFKSFILYQQPNTSFYLAGNYPHFFLS